MEGKSRVSNFQKRILHTYTFKLRLEEKFYHVSKNKKIEKVVYKFCSIAEWKLLIGSSRRTLIRSKDPFSSPLDLFTLFSISSPCMKPTFSDMLLSICSESIMTTEATELYSLMKKGGTSPSLASFNMLLGSLVASKQFQRTLD